MQHATEDPTLRYHQKHTQLLLDEGEEWKRGYTPGLARCHQIEDLVAGLNQIADRTFGRGDLFRAPTDVFAADAINEESRISLVRIWLMAAHVFEAVSARSKADGYPVDGVDKLGDHSVTARGELDQRAIALRRIERLARLKDDWNGYGAKPFSRELIAAVKAFVTALPDHLFEPFGDEVVGVAPFAVAVANGSIQLEWHIGDRILELEFEKSGEVGYLQWWPQKGVEDEASYPASDTARSVVLIEWALHGNSADDRGE